MMKMSDVFELPVREGEFVNEECRRVYDGSGAFSVTNKLASPSTVHAINNHDRLINLETDRKNAISKMSKSWQHNADDNDDLLTRFVEMANRQFEERDRLREFVSNISDLDVVKAEDRPFVFTRITNEAKQLLNGETK